MRVALLSAAPQMSAVADKVSTTLKSLSLNMIPFLQERPAASTTEFGAMILKSYARPHLSYVNERLFWGSQFAGDRPAIETARTVV
jgi:hypothetical protein